MLIRFSVLPNGDLLLEDWQGRQIKLAEETNPEENCSGAKLFTYRPQNRDYYFFLSFGPTVDDARLKLKEVYRKLSSAMLKLDGNVKYNFPMAKLKQLAA